MEQGEQLWGSVVLETIEPLLWTRMCIWCGDIYIQDGFPDGSLYIEAYNPCAVYKRMYLAICHFPLTVRPTSLPSPNLLYKVAF